MRKMRAAVTAFFVYPGHMIDKNEVKRIVDEWLVDKDYFLTDLTISTDNCIVIEIDHAQGVWIDDCVTLSRFVENALNREQEDFELEVGSAGIGQPFKVQQQYLNHVGDEVEILLFTGEKHKGMLTAANETGITLTTQEKRKEEGEKRPKLRDVVYEWKHEAIKQTKLVIHFT